MPNATGLKWGTNQNASSPTMKILIFLILALTMEAIAAPTSMKLQCVKSFRDTSKGKLAVGRMNGNKLTREHYLTVENGAVKPSDDSSKAQKAQLYYCENMAPPLARRQDLNFNGIVKLGDSQCLAISEDGTANSSECASSSSDAPKLNQQWFEANGRRLKHIGSNGNAQNDAVSVESGRLKMSHCQSACPFLFLE